jgi:hypothetical protein
MDPIEEIIQGLRIAGMSDEESRQELRGMLAHSESLGASLGRTGELRRRLAQISEGIINVVPWPFSTLSDLCPSLVPGFVTVVAGSPGATKSFMMLQCINWWIMRERKVSCLMLEGERSWHLQRLLAQLEKDPNLTSPFYISDHIAEVEEAEERHRERVGLVADAIDIPSSKQISFTYYDVMEWMTCRARQGSRIIIIDPITKADRQGPPWEEDLKMVSFANQLAQQARCSIIIVSHPKKDNAMPGFESLAGGAAMSRHVQALIWLSAFETKKMWVKGCCGRYETEANRVMHLLKVTDGRGQYKSIVCHFNPETLMLEEKGLKVKEDKEPKQ